MQAAKRANARYGRSNGRCKFFFGSIDSIDVNNIFQLKYLL